MPKPRGSRHEWDREGKTATCIRCGLTVPTYKIRKGGLTSCDQQQSLVQATLEKLLVMDAEEVQEAAMCLQGVNPIVACFSCPGRIDAKKCERLRIEGGYKPKQRNSPLKAEAITA